MIGRKRISPYGCRSFRSFSEDAVEPYYKKIIKNTGSSCIFATIVVQSKHRRHDMNNYKFKFSKPILLLSVLAILVAAGGGIGWTVYRMVNIGFQTVLLGIQYVVILLVSVLIIVIFSALLIRSYYKITDKEIVLWFGIIKSTCKIADIESIHLFTKTNKLVLYFKNERYTVIVVKPEWYNQFTKDILSKNGKIRYDVSTTDGTEKDDM